MTHLLQESMEQILSSQRERMRIGCFERTGCLLRLNPHKDDELVKPQDLKLPFTIPNGSHNAAAEWAQPPEEMMPNESIEEDLEDSIEDVPEGEDEGDITPEEDGDEGEGGDHQTIS